VDYIAIMIILIDQNIFIKKLLECNYKLIKNK